MTRLGRVLLVCVLLVATGSVSTAAADPTDGSMRMHPTGARLDGRIAFDACDAVGCDIYTANPDGTAVRRVTHDGVSFEPDWSPDGRRIAYVSLSSGATAVWLVNANGRHSRQLTPNEPDASNVWPRFAPDGRTVFYTNCLTDECDGGISAIRVDGSGQHVVTPNSGDSYNLGTPSPDGKRMVFMRWHVGGVKMRIYLKRLSGPRPRPEIPLTPAVLEGWAPDWSPTGNAVLFSSNLFGNRPNGAIYRLVLDATGHTYAIRKLTHPPFPLEDWAARYSPGGDRIVFVSDRRHPGRDDTDLFIERADGSGLHRLALPHRYDALFVEWPAWGTAPLKPATQVSASGSLPRPAGRPGLLCTSLRRSTILAVAHPSLHLGC